ncbi:MAG TPA: HAMP domain-containing protein, partial [Longimicrobiales bacterium]|nr:HAMP domain-containing protein [Longimicrobiales bacterium]
MGQLRSYFDRIQGRLIAAFAIALLGTVAIFLIGYRSLQEFAETATVRNDVLYRSMDIANRLQSSVLEQIASGEHYLVSRSQESETAFDSLNTASVRYWGEYNALPTLDESTREQLNRVKDLHEQIDRGYRRAHSDFATGNNRAAIDRVEALAPAVNEMRALIRALNSTQIARATSDAAELTTSINRRLNFMLTVLLFMTLLLGWFIWSTLKAVDQPLHRLVTAANQFGEGDLQISLNGHMPGEFRVLAGAFNGMAERFRGIVGETVLTAQKVGSSASD